jgi:spore germination cell wall hydrolase CwlJ-like protein
MEKLLKVFLVCFAAVVLGNLFYKFVEYKLETLKGNTKVATKYTTMAEREKQLECLAHNIYHEAAKESFEGKVAVAQVTINRAESGIFPSDICKVVYQKNIIMEKVVCQFSWYCEPMVRKRLLYPAAYDECYGVAKKVLLEGFRLESLTEAMYYHANYVNPKWNKQKITTIGNHVFYK